MSEQISHYGLTETCEAITAKYTSEQRLKLFKDKEKAVTH